MPTSSVLARITSACPDVAPATAADTIGGTPARLVAAPASTAEAAALLQAAAEDGLTVVPRGSGTKLDWGAAPASCDVIVDTKHLNSVIEHATGDLVASVQAGVTLAALAELVTSAGQRLALDPPVRVHRLGEGAAGNGSTPDSAAGGGTVGGVLATNVAGPLRFRFGAPRDLLIGITVVRADGTVARSGGKVVKNVAGYDLGKLFTGSYGTLGLITEATFRLHPLPTASAVITVTCPDPQTAATAVNTMSASPLTPSAIELDWPSPDDPISVAVLLEGDESSVQDRAARMGELLEPGTAGMRSAHTKPADRMPSRPDLSAATVPHDQTLLQIAFWPGQLSAILTAISTAAVEADLDPAISGSAGAGVLNVQLAPQSPADAVARGISALRADLKSLSKHADGAGAPPPSVASAVVLCAPPEVRDAVDIWGPVPGLALMRAVKDQFDPEHRMAPGRFAGGI